MQPIRAPEYRLYIDESGDHAFQEIEKPHKRYLGLTGIIVASEYYRTTFDPELEALKKKHFPRSPAAPLIFHRSEILNKKGSFGRLKNTDAAAAFDADLLSFFTTMEYVVITVVIDKKHHLEKYGNFAMHPYHYCLSAMIERYCGFLKVRNSCGDVLAESRGGVEDTHLKTAYSNLFHAGTHFRNPSFFLQALTSREIKLKNKAANIAGTQIADLIAHPSKQELLFEKGRISDTGEKFGPRICQAIASKYNRRMANGKIDGYGKIFLGWSPEMKNPDFRRD